MTINNKATLLDGMARRHEINMSRVVARSGGTAVTWVSQFDLATGVRTVGVLAGTNTANGVVPDSTTPGCPWLPSFNGSPGYLEYAYFGGPVICRLRLFDMLFKAGAYNFNDSVTLASQPSYLARIPNSDYTGVHIWIETVTLFTGIPTFTVTYTNQDGTTGRTATFTPVQAPALGRTMLLNLQAGDIGVQKIESVTCTGASAGTFNVLVLRQLWTGGARAITVTYQQGVERTALKRVYDTSAFYALVCPSGGNASTPSMQFGIVWG